MKVTAWMQRDKYAALVSRLTALERDYGAAFKNEFHSGNRSTSLIIHTCFYKQLYEAEEVPQLLSCSCCSIDRVWLEGAPGAGVTGKLTRSQAAGSNCCQFWIEKGDGEKRANARRSAALEAAACPLSS